MVLNEEMFDCLLHLPENKEVRLGDEVEVSMEFLSPEIVIPLLKVGKKFFLWETGMIAEGEVTKMEPK
jgi:hypothetical protein